MREGEREGENIKVFKLPDPDLLLTETHMIYETLKTVVKKLKNLKKNTIKIKNNTPTRSLINVTLNLTSTIRTQIMNECIMKFHPNKKK